MKRIFLLLTLLLLAAVLCIGCGQKEPIEESVEEDGGVQNNSSDDAPKTIESTLIISFQCEFSAMDIMEEDSYLSGSNYLLEARLPDGAVKGRYSSSGKQEEDTIFAASHSFMYKLQEVVSKYDLAQYNGTDISVSGLPEMYGADLRIVYASGERINARNNQDCFLPLEAMEELETLFRQHLPKTSVSQDTVEE